jgi:hypothetical protein
MIMPDTFEGDQIRVEKNLPSELVRYQELNETRPINGLLGGDVFVLPNGRAGICHSISDNVLAYLEIYSNEAGRLIVDEKATIIRDPKIESAMVVGHIFSEDFYKRLSELNAECKNEWEAAKTELEPESETYRRWSDGDMSTSHLAFVFHDLKVDIQNSHQEEDYFHFLKTIELAKLIEDERKKIPGLLEASNSIKIYKDSK